MKGAKTSVGLTKKVCLKGSDRMPLPGESKHLISKNPFIAVLLLNLSVNVCKRKIDESSLSTEKYKIT